MAYIGWLELGGEEFVNVARTSQLSEVMGIDILLSTPESVAWVQAALSEDGYDDITNAPWYDPAAPASEEFAGVYLLNMPGLDDSTASASTTELTTHGARTSSTRNSALNLVGSAALLGTTSRGVE